MSRNRTSHLHCVHSVTKVSISRLSSLWARSMRCLMAWQKDMCEF